MKRSASAHCSPADGNNATFLDTAQKSTRREVQKPHLTSEQRLEVYTLWLTRKFTQDELAARFGVSRPTIGSTVHKLHEAATVVTGESDENPSAGSHSATSTLPGPCPGAASVGAGAAGEDR